MITKNSLEKYKEALAKTRSFEGEVEDHITKILEMAIELNGGKLDTWYWSDATSDYGGMGTFLFLGKVEDLKPESHLGGYTTKCKKGELPMYGDFDLSYEMPSDFLYMSIEDIEEQLKEDMEGRRRKEKEKKAKAKARHEAKKAEKALILESAKKKLSKEELKVLGIK